MALVTESAATKRSFLKERPTDPGVPFPLEPETVKTKPEKLTSALN